MENKSKKSSVGSDLLKVGLGMLAGAAVYYLGKKAAESTEKEVSINTKAEEEAKK